MRGVNESDGIGVEICGIGLGVPVGRVNIGSGAPTGGEAIDVEGVEKVGCVPSKQV